MGSSLSVVNTSSGPTTCSTMTNWSAGNIFNGSRARFLSRSSIPNIRLVDGEDHICPSLGSGLSCSSSSSCCCSCLPGCLGARGGFRLFAQTNRHSRARAAVLYLRARRAIGERAPPRQTIGPSLSLLLARSRRPSAAMGARANLKEQQRRRVPPLSLSRSHNLYLSHTHLTPIG